MRRALDFDNFDSEYYHGLNVPPNGSSSGGGAPANLQEKSVLVTQNGTSQIRPDSGYDGLSYVSLTTNVPERLPELNISTTITQNTTTTVNAPMGSVLTSLQITTNVPANLTTLTTTLTSINTITFTPPPNYQGLSSITITPGTDIYRIIIDGYNEAPYDTYAECDISTMEHKNDGEPPDENFQGRTWLIIESGSIELIKTDNTNYHFYGPYLTTEINGFNENTKSIYVQCEDIHGHGIITFSGQLTYDQLEDVYFLTCFYGGIPRNPIFNTN